MTVEEFIAAEAEKPFRWGETDCCATVDRWVRHVVGFSPMSRFGRIHRDEAEAKAWLSEPGSIAVAVNRVARSIGFMKTDCPAPGDFGLILHDGKLCLAIHAGAYWFSRDESGLIGAPLSAVWKAWRVS